MCSLKMGGIKDPTIKLFGKTIQLPNCDSVVALKINQSAADSNGAGYGCSDQNILCSKQSENRGDEKSSMDESTNSKTEEEQSSSSVLEEYKTPTPSPKTPSKKDDPSDQSSSTQNPPKKPDKILPCPRCSSMNTKFCYFNNYNVNQPRHFCKNCQRYWTAGGTMRNVPVGAGRRKNKNSSSSASHHQTLVIPAPHNTLICHQAIRTTHGSLLAFGSNSNSNSPIICDNTGSRFPVSLYSSAQLPNLAPRTWDLQWVSTTPQSYLDQSSSTASSNSCSLGKRAWDGTLLRVSSSNNQEKVEIVSQRLVPKTLTIDDPSDAAKSSIWGTLGIKKLDQGCSSKGGSFFQGCHQSKDNGGIDHDRTDPSMVLQANPAAFSRSLAFHESAHPSC